MTLGAGDAVSLRLRGHTVRRAPTTVAPSFVVQPCVLRGELMSVLAVSPGALVRVGRLQTLLEGSVDGRITVECSYGVRLTDSVGRVLVVTGDPAREGGLPLRGRQGRLGSSTGLRGGTGGDELREGRGLHLDAELRIVPRVLSIRIRTKSSSPSDIETFSWIPSLQFFNPSYLGRVRIFERVASFENLVRKGVLSVFPDGICEVTSNGRPCTREKTGRIDVRVPAFEHGQSSETDIATPGFDVSMTVDRPSHNELYRRTILKGTKN